MNFFLAALLLGIAGYVLGRIVTARRAEARDEEQRAGYRRRIAQDPKNIGAYEALGDSLRRAGRLDEARDVYLGALDAGSDDHVQDTTRYKLKRVDEDIRTRARGGSRVPVVREMEFCPRCGAPNAPERRHCETCRALLPLPSFWDALRDKEVLRSSLEGVCMIVIVLVLVRLLSFLPIEIQGLLIISTAIVAAWRILQSVEGRRQ